MAYEIVLGKKKDACGNTQALVEIGNHQYIIVCVETGNKLDIPRASFDGALQIFSFVCTNRF